MHKMCVPYKQVHMVALRATAIQPHNTGALIGSIHHAFTSTPAKKWGLIGVGIE